MRNEQWKASKIRGSRKVSFCNNLSQIFNDSSCGAEKKKKKLSNCRREETAQKIVSLTRKPNIEKNKIKSERMQHRQRIEKS